MSRSEISSTEDTVCRINSFGETADIRNDGRLRLMDFDPALRTDRRQLGRAYLVSCVQSFVLVVPICTMILQFLNLVAFLPEQPLPEI